MILSQSGTTIRQVDPATASTFLEKLIYQQGQPKSLNWLFQQRQRISEGEERSLFMGFSLAARYFDSRPLSLTTSQLTEADKLRSGFMPQYWMQLQTARTLLLLWLGQEQQEEAFAHSLARLAETADVAEQTALYAAMPLLPHPLALRKRAAEGLRTNITVVFDAIALHNPYPADYLEERAWNQLVLKAVFMGRPLHQIWGGDTRTNPSLAQMLLDFAHERWAAQRSVTPELWRFVGPFLQPHSLEDVMKVYREGTPLEKEAALLACTSSTLPEARQLLDKHPEIAQQINTGTINWSSLGQRHNSL
ncbi:MAG: EboA domain-containing protein [Bacteroidetes bacterium]|nr:EboA domain-containing protein [Bacteroidota bacterium]